MKEKKLGTVVAAFFLQDVCVLSLGQCECAEWVITSFQSAEGMTGNSPDLLCLRLCPP